MATSGDTLTNDLDCYLVGGAVRDELLGRPGGDRDWVVVGADVEQMLAKGFVQIGRDFPVFLHPHSKEEYALARIERKRGAGHTGFTVIASPEVTLEEDLLRRDLTINAMARDRQGVLVDPFDGQADLAGRTFRQVSAAFAEDLILEVSEQIDLMISTDGAKSFHKAMIPTTLDHQGSPWQRLLVNPRMF